MDNFNPRAPCGARLNSPEFWRQKFSISIHAPRAGRDWHFIIAKFMKTNFNPRAPCGARPRQRGRVSQNPAFQSTRPVRGATDSPACPSPRLWISIHAPRAGRDAPAAIFHCPCSHFNPRAPCGARPSRHWTRTSTTYFNPRAPCGARRPRSSMALHTGRFQSTRPVRGATRVIAHGLEQRRDFNPRAPCGARHAPGAQSLQYRWISIHAPRAGRDPA